MGLVLSDLRVRYGEVRALDGVSLTLEPGELFFLLGPSGCGKSTLLRSVAGFIEDFDGDIRTAAGSLRGVPPHKRDFGMVFQNYALFPHLTVAGNVAFGLEARNVPKAECARRVSEALKLTGLGGYEARRPGELSGGQQQRVALARALVIEPRVLLLDEPLSNLDAKLRTEMREEIRRLHRALKITTLYVTHDQKEALALADRMAILRSGKIDALGTPRELYNRPPTRFSAEFLGELNALSGTLGAQRASVTTELGEIAIEPDAVPQNLAPGSAVTVFCRPEAVVLESAEAGHGAAFRLQATVKSSAFQGETTLVEALLSGGSAWRVLQHDSRKAPPAEGSVITLSVPRGAWGVVGV